MTHSQRSWQIPEFSSLGCWKHGHGYVPPLELNQTHAILPFLCFFLCPCVISPNSSVCLSDTVFVVIISSYILATQSEFRFPSLVYQQSKESSATKKKRSKKQRKLTLPSSLRPNKGNQVLVAQKAKLACTGGDDGYRDIGYQETDSDGPIHPVGWR